MVIDRIAGKIPLVVALCGVLLLAGCGYTLVGRSNNLPEDVRKIYVAPLENRTPRSQVEQILTQALLDELVKRRRFEVINSEAAADAVLRGAVVTFAVRPVTFDADGLANKFEISITADMRFERPPRGGANEPTVLWASSRYSFREDYPLTEGGLSYFDRENLAIEETAETFAETLVTDLLEGF
jgi:outer membrane lipopolysaccharide assembly protein LptE/RlpB